MKKNFRLPWLHIPLLFLLVLNFSCSKDDEPAAGINNEMHFRVENGEAVVSSLGHEEEAIVPSHVVIDGVTYPVTSIGGLACNKDVKKLHLPPTIKKISQSAFETNEIEELYLEDLAAWCNIDFDYDMSMGNTYVSFYTNACPFRKETKLHVANELVDTLVIPDDAEKISYFAFMNLNCKKIVIGSGVKTVGVQAFKGSAVKELVIGRNVSEISQQSFADCEDLQVLHLSENLEYIGYEAFDQSNPSEVHVPDWEAWLNISYQWEQGTGGNLCPQISDSYDLYIGGEKMTDVSVPPVFPVLKRLCFAGANIRSIVLEEGITSNNGWIFLGCRQLEKIVLPSSLERSAFSFLNCDSLKEVWAWCDVPEELFGAFWVFFGTKPACPQATLYVPEVYIENYKKANGWNTFKEILPIPDSALGE